MLATALQKHREDPVAIPYDLNEVALMQPLEVHKHIICVGLNYESHIPECEVGLKKEMPAQPVFFSKAPTSVIGPDDTIHLHAGVTGEVDYEGELAVIIGKRGSHIPEEEALDYVFGYTILNDVSARDLQRSNTQWFRAKSLDTFCPIGPAILLGEKKAHDFEIKTHVNGELRQTGTTDELIFNVPQLIAHWSQGLTLEPGDIIATGTPAGVGMSFTPPRYLQDEDEVAITISGIGTLKNTVGR